MDHVTTLRGRGVIPEPSRQYVTVAANPALREHQPGACVITRLSTHLKRAVYVASVAGATMLCVGAPPSDQEAEV
jgi:hypothetical protein